MIYGKQKDVWDLGILLFGLYCRMKREFNQGYSKERLDELINDPSLKQLKTSILKERKEDRPEIKDILDAYLPQYYDSKNKNENIKNENSISNHSLINYSECKFIDK